MKTKKTLLAIGIALMLHCTLQAQNFNVPVPAGQEVRNLSGNICCFFRNNVATDDNGNAYVLSETLSDSSIWVTKYDVNGNVVFNTRVGPPGYETNYHYRAKRIKVYDRVYVLCRMNGPLANPNYIEQETIFPLDKTTGAVTPQYGTFVPYFGHTSCEMVDLVQAGARIWVVGQTVNGSGPGSSKIQVQRWDMGWTGNSYLLGAQPGTDYLLNTESNCLVEYNGAIYMTGQASSSVATRLFVTRLDVWGTPAEYIYMNTANNIGGKGLNIATEGNSVYVCGGLVPQLPKQATKMIMLRLDTTLATATWATVSKSSEWPLGLALSGTDVIYTVDYALRVVGFSKSTGNQLFAKSDFKNYAQVYNQPISAVVLNNNQLMFQASVGVTVKGNATTNKLIAKYSTAGMKTYQQLENVSNISPGNPGSAEALGLSYSPVANRSTEVYRLNSASGTIFYVSGKGSPTSLRIAVNEEAEAGLSVYPNPAAETFTIHSAITMDSWTLYDMTMRKISSMDQAGNESVVDCREMPAGLYVLNIFLEDGNAITRKVMVR